LQDTQIAEIMQQDAALTCLDGAPATMAHVDQDTATACYPSSAPDSNPK
jgi:hypothetical protein